MIANHVNVTRLHAIRLFDTEPDSIHVEYGTSNLQLNQLIYILSGTHKVHFVGVEGIEYPDSVRFLPKGIYPSDSHYYTEKFQKSSDDLCIDIYFDTDGPYAPQMFITSFAQDKTLRPLFEQIYQVWYQKYDGYYHKSMALLYEILIKIEKAHSSYLPTVKYEQILPAIEYIDTHFTELNFRCEKLAELCGLSYSYFKKLFISRFGVPPIKYVNEKKIQYACDLLIPQQLSLTEIAQLTGFENVYYFSRVFKQHRGVPPSKYVKEITKW